MRVGKASTRVSSDISALEFFPGTNGAQGIGPKVSQSVITAAFLFAFKDVLYEMSVAARRKTKAIAK